MPVFATVICKACAMGVAVPRAKLLEFDKTMLKGACGQCREGRESAAIF
jgi:hypothetical protein